jgi:hypothetical protein
VDQTKKWQELLDNATMFQGKEGADLLKVMLMEVDELDNEDSIVVEQMELDNETVRVLQIEKGKNYVRATRGKEDKPKKKQWGPTLVERKRRQQNQGVDDTESYGAEKESRTFKR